MAWNMFWSISGQWPVDLPSALSLLPQAYFRLCQQGDAEGCKRLEATTELMAYGQELNRSYEIGNGSSLFPRPEGDLVTIAMQSPDFDTLLKLQGPGGVELSNDDSDSTTNSQIEYVLPQDGVYLILPSAYSGEAGGYQLLLDGFTPRTLRPTSIP